MEKIAKSKIPWTKADLTFDPQTASYGSLFYKSIIDDLLLRGSKQKQEYENWYISLKKDTVLSEKELFENVLKTIEH